MERSTTFSKGWNVFANTAGIAAIVFGLAYVILLAFSQRGPVVEVLDGPGHERREVPYLGTLVYDITTRRLESCPGTVRIAFRNLDSAEPVVVSTFDKVPPRELGPEQTTRVERILPQNVYPGRWLYTSTVASTCPLREQLDVTAHFEIEVLPIQE